MLASRNSRRFPLLWFDEEKGEQRALRYARNQQSPFEDEQDGNAILEPIVFEDGFFWREKKLLGRKEGGVVVQAQLGTIIYRSKDELAVFGHRPYYLSLLHEARHEGAHILLVNHFERHNLLPLPG